MDAHDHIRPHFNFDNSFARSLEGFYASCEANPAIAPKFLLLNQGLAEELGLSTAEQNWSKGRRKFGPLSVMPSAALRVVLVVHRVDVYVYPARPAECAHQTLTQQGAELWPKVGDGAIRRRV